ncbi:hypothetical protein PIROE2DRAFT_63058 [Piromyces sp. E2]|nr:hypothetical protein PIROE2DRAFT_63058 [Piromyces sp. E2]|eukprot:OUM60582.1 hypothetical protein PIROE2DRAFT_63058 [Piromyces sp. E2]
MKINHLLVAISLIITGGRGVQALPSHPEVEPIASTTVEVVESDQPTVTTFVYQSFGDTYTKVEPIPTNVSNMIMICNENEKNSHDSFEKEHNKHCFLNNLTRHGERGSDSIFKNFQNYIYECYDVYKSIELTNQSGNCKTCRLYSQNTEPVQTYTEFGGCMGNACVNSIYKVNEVNTASTNTKTLPITTTTTTTTTKILPFIATTTTTNSSSSSSSSSSKKTVPSVPSVSSVPSVPSIPSSSTTTTKAVPSVSSVSSSSSTTTTKTVPFIVILFV